MDAIKLSDLHANGRHADLEMSTVISDHDDEPTKLHGASGPLRRRLFFNILVSATLTFTIYYNYQTLIDRLHPLVAPALLGSVSAAFAQTMNQYLKKKIDFNRIFKFMVWGSINGTLTVLWIDLLLTRLDSAVYRIVVDQTVGAPAFQATFSILNSLWETGELISTTARSSYLRSLRYSYCYWPIFSVCLFLLVPPQMMFPANCLANLLWNLILSRLT